MRSIYIQYLVRPAAAPLVLRMSGHTWGVAITCYYPYPAIGFLLFFQNWIMKLNNLTTIHMNFIFCSIYLQFLVNFTGLRKRHPLKIMADLKRTNLLSHPLTTSMLDKKWWKSIWLYFTVFLIYAIYITFLTGYMLVNEPPFSFKRYAFVTTLI